MAQLGRALTARQKEIWDLQRPLADGGQGKTYPEIASLLSISYQVVANTLGVVRRKLGIPKLTNAQTMERAIEASAESRLTENVAPEKAAAILDAITEPLALKKLKQAYVDCGLPGPVGDAIVRRLKNKYFGGFTATRDLKAAEIASLFSHKIDLAALYMDDKSAGEASFRDLAMAAAAMAEKRQLLRGEATQIISNHEREKLHTLLPLLITEGRRRGIIIDGTAITIKEPA